VGNRRADELYRVLFDHVDNMACTLDLEGRFSSLNAAGERLTGFSAGELIGRYAVEVIAPEHRDRAVEQFRRRLETTGELPADESVLLARDGSRVAIEITSALLLQDDEPTGVLGLVRDLSERRGAEQALHQSEERFKTLLEAAPDGVVIADTGGRIVLVNVQTELLFGYPRAELVGQPVEMLLPEAVRAAHAGHRAKYHADPKVREMGAGLPLAGLRKDGSRFPVDVSLSPLQTAEGLLVLASVRDVSERRRAEEALLESEQRFRSTFESAPVGMAVIAPDRRFLQVNDSLCELVGRPADELCAMTWQDITHPDDLDADADLVRRLLAGEIRTYQIEKRYRHRLGHDVWSLVTVSLVRGRDGEPLHLISQIQDITDRKRAGEELARSEMRLADAQRIAQIGNWDLDVADDTVTWSDELYRIFDLDPGTETPSVVALLERIHPEDGERVEQLGARVRETGEAYTHQYRIVLRDGTTRWVEGRGVSSFEDGGMSMRGTVQDITEHKSADEKLAEAEERYRTLVEQLPLGTYVRPLDMREPNIYASPQVEPMLGYPAEDWMTNPDLLASIVHPDDRGRVLSQASHLRQTGVPVRDEYRYVRPDGRVVWVQDETFAVAGEDGKPVCVQGYLLDITERKEAEEERDRLREELHHAQKLEAVGRLAGGVAHDFNNMLTAIKGYSELLLVGLDADSPLRSETEQIRRAAEQASVLPRQLLAFSRKQVLEPKLIDLNAVVSDATDLLRLVAGESIELVTKPVAGSAVVLADPSQVEQVLLNLAVNARDAMPDGGVMAITTRNVDLTEREAGEHEVSAGNYVVVSVSDTGAGMDSDTLERVFEPFFTTKTAGKGSGLGLASAYGITRQSGGFITAKSQPGRGATFAIHFPLADGAVAAAPDAGDPAELEASAGTVLLVEDEDVVRDFAATALERAGYRVLSATHGAAALDVCEEATEPIDVLVSDMVMPGMGGRELAERVLELDAGTRVVLMSGYTDDPSDSELPGGTASTFLQKPFSLQALVGAVGDALEKPAPTAANGKRNTVKGITCVVADDHPAVLDSVSRFLEASGIEVVARVARGDEALEAIKAYRPEIVLLDVAMEPTNGVEIAKRAARISPESGVILYTGHRDRELLEQALEAGARGFVLKEAPLSELTRAMKAVVGGGTFVDPELSAALVTPRAVGRLSPLTPRERQVLVLVADGMTNDRAAEALGISAETVQSHVRNAMSKLEAETRTQAVATALRQALI